MLRHKMVIVWSEEKNCYLVHLPDFPEQLYRTGGDSYVEAAKNGEEVLQQLLKGEQAPAATSATSDTTTENKAATAKPLPGSLATDRPIEEATRLTSETATSLVLQPQKQLYRWIPTALVSFVTSATAVTALVMLAFVSEGVISQAKPTSTALPTEQSQADLESTSPESTAPESAPPKSALKTNEKTGANAAVSTNATQETSPPLALINSITDASTVWAIATYSDAARNFNLVVSGNETGQIVIREQTSGQPTRTIDAHDDKVRSIAIAPKARRILSSSGDGIKAWDLGSGELIYELASTSPIWSIAIAPDESRFVSGAHDGNIAAWDLATGELLYNIGNGATVWSVAISPDGNTFISGDSNRAIRQWSLKTGQSLQTLTGHEGDVRTVAFSPDGKTLASGSWDKTVKLWSVETGKLLKTLEGHRDRVISLAISNDGETLATGSVDATVKRWRLSDYQIISTLEDPFDWVLAVAVASDGTLITGGKDREIRLWQAEKSASR